MKNAPKKPKNITEVLEKTIEDWGLDNAPLIFKTEGYVSAQDTGFVCFFENSFYLSPPTQFLRADDFLSALVLYHPDKLEFICLNFFRISRNNPANRSLVWYSRFCGCSDI